MHKWTVRAARVALVAAAFSAAGAGVANADDTMGDHSILGGNQFRIPIIAPIGLFGNHVNVLSSGYGGYRFAHVHSDDSGAANNQAAPAEAQMDICGNAISSAHGAGAAACKGQAKFGGNDAAAAPAIEAPNSSIGAPNTGIGAPGTPLAAPAEAPAAAPAAAPAVAPAVAPADAPAAAPIAAPAEAPAAAPAEAPAEMSTSGHHGVLSGNQSVSTTRMPIRICGNAGALGGVATAACEGTASIAGMG